MKLADGVVEPDQDLTAGAVKVVRRGKHLTGRIVELGAGDPVTSEDRRKSLRPGEGMNCAST
jgi:hypothetical protein